MLQGLRPSVLQKPCSWRLKGFDLYKAWALDAQTQGFDMAWKGDKRETGLITATQTCCVHVLNMCSRPPSGPWEGHLRQVLELQEGVDGQLSSHFRPYSGREAMALVFSAVLQLGTLLAIMLPIIAEGCPTDYEEA